MSKIVKVVEKTQKILAEAKLPPNAVPPRLFLPIVEASSVENDESLQDLWAGLLATASQETDSLSPSFIETLKQLTPDEALDVASRTMNMSVYPLLRLRGHSPQKSRLVLETFERLGLLHREYSLIKREAEVGYTLRFAGYGKQLLKACRGPRRPRRLL